MSRIIQTISVPSGGKASKILEDMRRKGKNVSHTVCEIIERHLTLYDDNIKLEEENKELLYDYHTIVSAAMTALEEGGKKWELYFPPDSTKALLKKHGDGGYGLAARVHFRKVEESPTTDVGRIGE